MALIEEAIATRMNGYAELTALIGARLYPLLIPQDVPLPAIAYQKIDGVPQRSHSGFSSLARSRFQFTCDADDYAAVKAVAAAVRHCWESYRGTVEGIRIDGAFVESDQDGYSEQNAAPVVRLDVIIWHEET